MSPEYVRPYVKSQKNDDRDAEAIAGAATRPTKRFVELKSEAQLDMQTLHRARDRLVGERTALINQLRAILLERGITVAQGRRQLERHLAGLSALGGLSQRLRVLIEDMRRQWCELDGRIAEFDKESSTAVSLYLEHGRNTFHSVHVESAQRVALEAQRAGVRRLVHVSGIGADPYSLSLYIRKRGEGEVSVRAAFADAILIRPAVMFGPDDGFLTLILRLLKWLPVYPMFGNGQTRLQPVYVEDVAEAIAMAVQPTLARPITFECGGPRVYSYEELLRAVAHEANIRFIPISIPFVAWRALARISEFLPRPPITRNQVELMQIDNVSSAQLPGFSDLGISPHSIEQILQEVLRQS